MSQNIEEAKIFATTQSKKLAERIAKSYGIPLGNIHLQRFKDGDSAQALQAYNKIMGQCMKCHREIRHW